MAEREPAAREPGARRPTGRDALVAFGHLAVLSTFALAQPLFDLLSDNPEFFAARGSPAGDIIVFALALVLVPPALLLAAELLVGLAGPTARRAVHLVLTGLLAALIFVQALKDAIGASDAVLIALALALGALAAAAYARAAPVRSFMSVLTPAPLVFLALFLFVSPVSKLTIGGEASAKSIDGVAQVPVVMVVFDELPSTSLMDDRRMVDADRYPAFARLARDGTWFRNAHTIYDSTSKAVPAIMDGAYPEKGTLPISSDHPDSIFTLLGRSHRLNVSEEATTVCPRDLCDDARLDEPFLDRLSSITEDLGLVYAHVVSPPGIERDLPSVSETWGDFGGGDAEGGDPLAEGQTAARPGGARAAARNTRANLNRNRKTRFEDWIRSITPGSRPSLNFKHALLPHVPWQYLPDGRQYRTEANDPISGISRESYDDAGQIAQLQLRHQLQLGFADREIGKLIDHLERTGLYEESLIVITADHGVAFEQGLFNRRRATRSTLDEIAPVPLFVKRPGRRRGRIDDSIVETTDILPTIADVLGIERPRDADGRSAFGPQVRRRDEVKLLVRDMSRWIRVDGEVFGREKRAVLAEQVRLFGTGADGPDRIYRVGPNRELVGRAVSGLAVGRESDARAELVEADELGDVDLSGRSLPTWIAGRVSGGGGERRDIAVAVNGAVAAVGNTFELATGGGEILSVMVPPSALREGRNEVVVYEVVDELGLPELRRMGGT